MLSPVVIVVIVLLFSQICTNYMFKRELVILKGLEMAQRKRVFDLYQFIHHLFIILVLLMAYKSVSKFPLQYVYVFFFVMVMVQLFASITETKITSIAFPLHFKKERPEHYFKFVPYQKIKMMRYLSLILVLMCMLIILISEIKLRVSSTQTTGRYLSYSVYTTYILIVLIARQWFMSYFFHEYRIKSHVKRLGRRNQEIDRRIKEGISLEEQIADYLKNDERK